MKRKNRLTLEECIERARKLYGDAYDYSLITEYKNNYTKVPIKCKKHNIVFHQSFGDHLAGHKCPKCSYDELSQKLRITTEKFIERARIVHSSFYSYDKVGEIKNTRDKVIITCPIHGDFTQEVMDHLRGHKCPKCAKEKTSSRRRLSKEEFISKAISIHGNKYDYSKVEYTNNRIPITIICPIHGPFWQIPNNHLSGNGCPKCASVISKYEDELSEWLTSLNIRYERRNRTILNGRELDIYIPSHSLAIEINGLYFHSDKFISDPNFHLSKTIDCLNKGITLLHIFEDEWIYKKDVVKSIILSRLGLCKRVYARECTIMDVERKDALEFLTENHLQTSSVITPYSYGLYYNNELVMLMVVCKPRFIRKKYDWEVIRVCTKKYTTVVGGLSKLTNHIRKLHPGVIISYVDRRWFDGRGYEKCGWRLVGTTTPNYFYIRETSLERESRHKYQKHKLKQLFPSSYNPTKTEVEIMREVGYYRIFDCGNLVYVLD